MSANHLATALTALQAEEKSLKQQLEKIQARLSIVNQGIESLSAIIDDELGLVPAKVVELRSLQDTPYSISPSDIKTLPLKDLIWRVLHRGPMTPREIAEQLRSAGYVSTSQDFANVIGSILRTNTQMFVKGDDGRWNAIQPF